MSTKTCTKCRAKKPANKDNFRLKGDAKDGFTSHCKECLSAAARKANRKTVRSDVMEEQPWFIEGLKNWRRNNPKEAK